MNEYDLGVDTFTRELLTGRPIELDPFNPLDDYYVDTSSYNREKIQETRRKFQWARSNLSFYADENGVYRLR